MKVNNGPKNIIHTHLEKSNQWISGESLSEILGISRVAVWKHLQSMKEGGYPLESGKKGYRITPGEDSLHPWAMGDLAPRIHYLQSTESTMKEAHDLAFHNAAHNTVVVAETQSSSQALSSHNWHSPTGGLYFTLILRPDLPLHQAGIFSFTASLAVVKLMSQMGLEGVCGWPNEVITAEGKLAGILAQVSGTPDKIDFLNLGVGIHVNSQESPKQDCKTAYLSDLGGHRYKRRDILIKFLTIFDELLHKDALDQWIDSFKAGRDSIALTDKGGFKKTKGHIVHPDGAMTLMIEDIDSRIYPGEKIYFSSPW